MTAGAARLDRAVSPLVLFAACGVVGMVTGVLPHPLYAVGAVFGLAYLAVALVSPVSAVTLFVVLTFLSQISGIGATVSIEKGAGAVLVLGWLYHERVVEPRPWSDEVRRFTILSAAFIVWGIASTLWASDPHSALTSTLRIAQGPLLVLVVASVVRTVEALRVVCYAFVAGAAAAAVGGMAGLTKTDAVIAASGRLSGGILDPNYLAAVLVPAVVLSLFLALTSSSRLMKVAIGAAGGVSTIGIFLTQSRGGVIALGVAAVGSVVAAGRFRRQVVLVLSLVGAFAAVYLLLFAPPQSFSRITSFTANDGSGRTDLWAVAAKAFEQHPVNGIGAGNFTVVEQQYAVNFNRNLPRADLVVQVQQPVHNTYLHVATELGLVGLGLFLAILWIALRACYRAATRSSGSTEALGRAIVVGSVGMLVAFVFLTAQYEKQLWLVIALLLAYAAAAARVPPRAAPRAATLRPAPAPVRPLR